MVENKKDSWWESCEMKQFTEQLLQKTVDYTLFIILVRFYIRRLWWDGQDSFDCCKNNTIISVTPFQKGKILDYNSVRPYLIPSLFNYLFYLDDLFHVLII